MTTQKDIRVVSIKDGFEQVFWNHVNQDPFHYYFFILDMKQRPEQTEIFLVLQGERIQGLLLLYSDLIVQLRGNRGAVEKLLDYVDLEKVELQAPLDCEDIVTRKYKPQVRHREQGFCG